MAEFEIGRPIFSGLTYTRKRKVRVRKSEYGAWTWECTLCHPISRGSNKTHAATLRRVQNHLVHRWGHHKYVLEAHGSTMRVTPTVYIKALPQKES